MIAPGADALVVVKLGGGLTAIPGALDEVCRSVGILGAGRRVVVVPGGGPFADAVRGFAKAHGLSADAAHWMAILAMDQYAHALVERIEAAVLVEDPGALAEALRGPGVAVLAPYRWMRAADVLPHSWDATSDSVAAFVAGALDAERLILVKPAAESGTGQVDPCFPGVVPTGLPWTAVAWDRLGAVLGPINLPPAGPGGSAGGSSG